MHTVNKCIILQNLINDDILNKCITEKIYKKRHDWF